LTFLEALSIARELAGAEPGNRAHNRLLISIRWDIAEMYLLQGEREKALAEWTKTIEREPASADAWFWRAEFRRRSLHQWEEALADYSQVIELDPKRADARDKLAWILLTCPNQTLRDPPRALTLAQEAVELEPDQGPYWNTLGVAHYRAGQWQKAIEALEESVRLYEGRDLSFNAFFLAIAHWQRGERDVARRWYDEAVAWMREHRPDDERLVAFRMEAEHLMGLSTKQDPPMPEP
jgi:tetratricopeptide (TPR) repeat protein